MEAILEGPIPGCVRLQTCGLLPRFCRDLQNYLLDIVDGDESGAIRNPCAIHVTSSLWLAPILTSHNFV